MTTAESNIERDLVSKLQDLAYSFRPDIRDRATLEHNFREKFEALNCVHLTDPEFARVLEETVTPDVFNAARTLRERNSFTRDDGTPLNYTLSTSRTGAKIPSRSSISSASIPIRCHRLLYPHHAGVEQKCGLQTKLTFVEKPDTMLCVATIDLTRLCAGAFFLASATPFSPRGTGASDAPLYKIMKNSLMTISISASILI